MTRKTVTMVLCGLTAGFLLFCGGYFLGKQSDRGIVVRTEEHSTEPAEAAEAAVPLRLVPEDRNPDSQTDLNTDSRIDLNTATLEELETLPGIGPVLGQRILDYRAEHGRFEAVSDLMLVEGIGEKTLERLEQYLIVR